MILVVPAVVLLLVSRVGLYQGEEHPAQAADRRLLQGEFAIDPTAEFKSVSYPIHETEHIGLSRLFLGQAPLLLEFRDRQKVLSALDVKSRPRVSDSRTTSR